MGYKLFSRHKKGHGIHSPFLYELIRTVFRNKIDPPVVLLVERIRKSCKRDRRVIAVNDLGAGSLVGLGKNRRVSDIALNSSVPKKYGALLFKLASAYGGTAVLELGTSLGISTMYLASGAKGSVVHTVEGCRETARLANENYSAAGITNIEQHIGSFDVLLPKICGEGVEPGLVFIDGNHRRDAVLGYFNYLADLDRKEMVIVIDDIYLSREMVSAWEVIKQNNKVTLSLDLYRMGIVFFRSGLTKCNCTVRY